jgi:nitroreductase
MNARTDTGSSTPNRGVLLDMVRHAARAPSSHNTQPWLFRLQDDAIDLVADRTRALPVNDPDDRELTLSCGCALLHLRIAAAHAGFHSIVQHVPEPADEDWLATVHLARGRADLHDARLFDAIALRRTWRRRFVPRPIAPEYLQQFAELAAEEGAWLHVLHPEPFRSAAADLVAEGDACLWSDPRWRRELAAWMHPRRRGDGLQVPALARPLAQAVVRTFDMGQGIAAKDRQLAEASPVLAVIGTSGDAPGDWLRAGQALGRILLSACLNGMQASYLNQPVQVPALRLKLQHLVGRPGFVQLLLRLGYADGDCAASPRRPVEDLLDAAG